MRVVLVLLFAVCVSSKPNKEVESTEQESETNQNYQPMLTAMIDNLKDGLDDMKDTLNKMVLETCQETDSTDENIGTKMLCHTQLQEDWGNCRDRCDILRTFSLRTGCKSAHWFIYIDLCFIGEDNMACSEIYLPLVWPSGQYGLPMPNSRCPGGILWSTGFNRQITEATQPLATASPPPTRAQNENEFSSDSFLHGVKNQVFITQGFCMKVDSASGRGSWPKGHYCIYKLNSCPSGFQEGSVTWSDEAIQTSPNLNRQSGTLPAGSFLPISTQIEFCCRDDGSVSISINLPVGRPFFLFRRGRLCQQVRGMRVFEESVKWDTEDNTPSTSSGSIPDSDVGQTVRLRYCYYRGV